MKKTLITLSLMTSVSLFAGVQVVNLEQAIAIALKNNNSLKISQTSVQIAQAMYKQAMSANYPTLDASVSAMRMDEALTFDMVGTTTVDNTGTKALYAGVANGYTQASLNPYATPQAKEAAATSAYIFNQTANSIPNQSTLPIDMNVKIADRDTVLSKLTMQYPLYVGGKISAITKQASLGKKIAQEGKRRTKNQVIYDVKRYYYGVVLTKQLKKLSHDTVERMSFIKELTSRLYKGGSMHVKKTDYLRSKLSVSLMESLDEKIGQKEAMAKAALLNAMGLSWQTKIDVSDTKLQEPVMNEHMKELVDNAYKFNPDYTTLKLAINVKKAKVEESKSGFLPHIGLSASVQNIYNDYDYGMVNDTNKNSWTIGIGATWSLFNGMRTTNEVEQSRLEKMKLEQTKVLLKEGLALQVKQAFLEMRSSYKQFNILNEAVEDARENRDLNTRAYQEDMVETKDVIEAQFFESYTQGDFYRCEYAHAVARAKLDFIVGAAVVGEK